MAKHLSKNELLRKCKELQELKRGASRSPFTGMSTLCNYVMWAEEKWYPKKLAEYNARFAEYDRKIDAGEVLVEDIGKRLRDKAGFEVAYVAYTYADIKVPKSMGFLYQVEKTIIDSNNEINELCVRYLLIHYQVLMDMGYGDVRLNRNQGYVNKWLTITANDEGETIMDLRRKLMDEAGIVIEMPNVRG